MTVAKDEDLPLFTRWFEFLCWLLPTTERFPHKVRFTLAQRIDHLALDVAEDLVEARYTRQKQEILKRANLRLERLRILVRLSQRLGHLPTKQYEHASRELYEVGRMLGGWRKEVEGRR